MFIPADYKDPLESDSFDEDDILEVFDLERDSEFFLTSIDMTSLASLMFTDRDKRSNCATGGSAVSDEGGCLSLTLAYERLHSVPKTIVHEFGPTLQMLDISHNRIRSLDWLSNFRNLTSLIADNNFISDDCSMPPMPNLEILWLNHNRIDVLYPWIKKLQVSCPNLKHLSLMGNGAAPSYLNGGSFYEYLQYRLFVISLFPSLTYLDDRPVTEDQRKEAIRLYKRPLMERICVFANRESNRPSNAFVKLYSNLSHLFDNTRNVKKRQNLLI